MRITLLVFLSVICFNASAQPDQQTFTRYVASKAGLGIREKPDAKATVLGKIPYGTKVSIVVSYNEEPVKISTEGMDGSWVKTSYEGKTGYVVNSYLLPIAPPKAGTKTMQDYFKQLSTPAGAPVTIKNGNSNNIRDDYFEIKKQVFKNGFEIHESTFYEANEDIYFLPDLTLEQGFVLVRLIPEFEKVFAPNDVYPTTDKITKRGDDDYKIEVIYVKSDFVKMIDKIKVSYSEGAYYEFQMFHIGNQLVISFGGGV